MLHLAPVVCKWRRMKTIEFTMTTSFPQLPLGPAGGYDIGYVLNLFTFLHFQSQILNGESPIE